MRVMFVVGTLPPDKCGVGDYVQELASAISREYEHPVFAVSFGSSVRCRTYKPDGSTVDSVATTDGLFGLFRLLQLHQPDVVHVQFPSQGFYGRLLPSALPVLCMLLRRKVVVTHHEIYRSKGWPRALLQSTGSRASVFVRPNFIDQCPSVVRRVLTSKPWAFIQNASPIAPSRLEESARRRLREELAKGRRRLLVFFGFVYPSKGVHLLFQIGNPETDHILIAGDCTDDQYRAELNNEAASKGWKRSDYEFLGFTDPQRSSDILSAADAVVLPFMDGGGEWNTSIHGAVSQGTLVITTSRSQSGFNPERNTAYRSPGDVEGMKEDLERWCGHRVPARDPQAEWRDIAARHAEIYVRATR